MAPSISQLGVPAEEGVPDIGKKNIAIDQTMYRELDASDISIALSKNPRAVPTSSAEWGAETVCTDHMITVQWTAANGWAKPELKPYGPLALMPTANVLHYATTCFEGMKLYRGYDGGLRLFRPSCNTQRMVLSATRIALPQFPPDELLKLIVKLCSVDGTKWLPREQPGRVLYIRPVMIGDDPCIGVRKPKRALLYITLSLMPVMDEKTKGLSLMASEEACSGVRAWPGGHGWAKVGANYGPSLMSHGVAEDNGCDQVLWLLRRSDGRFEVTEAGASNFFLVWRSRQGDLELVTAPLDDRIILDGVTRRSLLQLARERLQKDSAWSGVQDVEKLTVVERSIEMRELIEAVEEGRMIEAFAAGTAFFVAPVSLVRYYGKDLKIGMAEGSTGTYARLLKNWLRDIMFGREPHHWMLNVQEPPC